MLKKEEISSDHNSLPFMIPQVGREIHLRIEQLIDSGTHISKGRQPVLEEMPLVYQVDDELCEIRTGSQIAVFYKSIEDIIAFRKYARLFSCDEGYYGYTRLDRNECNQYLSICPSERISVPFLVDTLWYALRTQEGRFILMNPFVYSDSGYSYLFSCYKDLELEVEAVKEFEDKC